MDLRTELLEGLQAAASGAFVPRFYQVRVSPRRAFQYFGGCSIGELARRFHRNRRTIRKALGDPVFTALAR